MTVMRIIYIILFCSFFSFAMAQNDDGDLKDYAGHATYTYSSYDAGYDYRQSYTPAEETILKGKLESMANHLKSNLLITKPKGVEIKMDGMISEKAPLSEWNNRLKTQITLLVYPWFMKNGKPEYKCIECEVGFMILINRTDMAFNGISISGGADVLDADGIVMNVEPDFYGEQDGCKVYGNGIIVIAKNEPVWIPVTVKVYDEALIRKYEKLNKEYPSESLGNNFLIGKIKDEMASFSEQELNSPAYIGDKIGGCPYKLDNAKAIVKMNPQYFDKNKPRTATELIIISSFYISPQDNTDFYPTTEYSTYQAIKLTEILKSLNYSELRRFFD